MKLNKLFSRSTNKKTLEYVIEIQNNKYRTISGYSDGVKTISEWTICKGKNIGKKNETTPEQQALIEAQAIHRKKMETGWFETISDIDDETFFKPMLANNWEDYKDKVSFPLYSQAKLDGIRCIVKKDGMWSRNGKKIISAPHIYNSLKPLFEINPDLIFDGELYADKFANDFNAICSLVKKTKPTQEDLNASAKAIEYHIYDLPSSNKTFLKRIYDLGILFETHNELYSYCRIVDTRILQNEDDVMKDYGLLINIGYEGQIIRLDKEYENKRSKSLLKHKSFIDEEYTILDIEEGIGNKTGMVGSFVFQNKNGKQFNASPKFNWDECKQMWKEKNQLIGKSATVKYFNLTPDGIPRFGFVTKIAREDYE